MSSSNNISANQKGSKVFELNEYDELVTLNNSQNYVNSVTEFTKEWDEDWTKNLLRLYCIIVKLGDRPEYYKICTFLKLYPDDHDKISNIIIINIYIENMCQHHYMFNKNNNYLISFALNRYDKFEKYVVDILLDYYKKYKYIGINKYIDQISIPDLDSNHIYFLKECDNLTNNKDNYYYMSVELLEKLKDAKIIVNFERQIIDYYTNRKNYSGELYELLKYIYINNLVAKKEVLHKCLLHYAQTSELFLKYIEDFDINDNNIIIEGLGQNQNAFSMDILKLFINDETIGKKYSGSKVNILVLILTYNCYKVTLDDIKYIVEFAKCNNIDLMSSGVAESNETPLKCIINKGKITDYENIIYYLIKETILSEQKQ